jgi:hypothetical protein
MIPRTQSKNCLALIQPFLQLSCIRAALDDFGGIVILLKISVQKLPRDSGAGA